MSAPIWGRFSTGLIGVLQLEGQELRRLSDDVVTLEELGKADQALPDAAVLALATEEHRAVVTLDRRG